MRTINTSAGPKQYDPTRPGHTLNTSRVVEEDLIFEDEAPEIVHVLNPARCVATFEDGHHEELLFWCLLDDETVHGVALDEDGRVNLSNNVENNPNFVRYSRGANINDKE